MTANLSANGLNPTELNIAGALNKFFNSGGVLPPAFASLFSLSGNNLGNALTQLSGQPATGATPSIASMQTSFATLMLNPNITGRSGADGVFGALGYAPEPSRSSEVRDAYAAVTPREPLSALIDPQNNYSVWGSVYGGYNQSSGSTVAGTPTSTTRGGGVAAGLDYRLAPDTIVGFALAGGATSWSVSQALGSGQSSMFQAGIFGSQRFGNAYLSGSLGFGSNWMTTDRYVTVTGMDHLTASFTAPSFTGRVEAGNRFETPYLGVTPYLAGQLSSLHTPSYSETAASGSSLYALSYTAQTSTNSRGEVGLWLDKKFPMEDGAQFSLRSRFGFAHDWWTNASVAAQFASLPTVSFTVNGVTPAPNLGLASIVTEVKYKNGMSIGLKVDGEISSSSKTIAGTGVFRYSW